MPDYLVFGKAEVALRVTAASQSEAVAKAKTVVLTSPQCGITSAVFESALAVANPIGLSAAKVAQENSAFEDRFTKYGG